MKVNPTSTAGGGDGPNDEKSLLPHNTRKGDKSTLGSTQANLMSLSRSRARREKRHNCNKILKKIVDGKSATVIMSAVTLFALFGVRIFHINKP